MLAYLRLCLEEEKENGEENILTITIKDQFCLWKCIFNLYIFLKYGLKIHIYEDITFMDTVFINYRHCL